MVKRATHMEDAQGPEASHHTIPGRRWMRASSLDRGTFNRPLDLVSAVAWGHRPVSGFRNSSAD